MKEFISAIDEAIEQTTEMLANYLRFKNIQKEGVNIIEGLLYSNVILNFRHNLTEENLKEYGISEQEKKLVNRALRNWYYRSNKTVKSGTNVGSINSNTYKSFRKKLRETSRRAYKLLLEFEKEIDLSTCKKRVSSLKRELPKLAKQYDEDADLLEAAIFSALLSSKKELPDSKELSKLIRDTITNALPDASKVLLKHLKKTAPAMVKERRKYRQQFENRLMKTWKKPFDLMEMLYVMAVESGEEFSQKYEQDALQNQDFLLEALTRIHARGCQIFYEIMTLLKSGLADGAHARWRSLHELAVIAFFIGKHGNEVAERYLDHIAVENYRQANNYQEYCQRLGHSPMKKKELEELEEEKDGIFAKYGKDFFEGDYGWVPKSLIKGRRNFAIIEKSLRMDMWRPYYKMACINVHAGAKSLFFRLGLMQESPFGEVLLAGPSNFGFVDPAQGAAVSLHQITTVLLTTKPASKWLMYIHAMNTVVNEATDAFVEVQANLEEKEREFLSQMMKEVKAGQKS